MDKPIIGLDSLPERFMTGPKPKKLAEYITRKYSQYGYRCSGGILYNPEWEPDTPYGNRYRWVEHPSDGLRRVGAVHEIARNEGWYGRCWDARGWYVDNYQSETTQAIVFQLPSRSGKPCYIPANSDPYNDAAVLDFHAVTDDLREACGWAQSMAEHYADDCREHEAQDSAETRIEEIDLEVKGLRDSLRAICREIRGKCEQLTGMEQVKAMVRREVKRVRQEIRGLRKEQAGLREDYWRAVPQ